MPAIAPKGPRDQPADGQIEGLIEAHAKVVFGERRASVAFHDDLCGSSGSTGTVGPPLLLGQISEIATAFTGDPLGNGIR